MREVFELKRGIIIDDRRCGGLGVIALIAANLFTRDFVWEIKFRMTFGTSLMNGHKETQANRVG